MITFLLMFVAPLIALFYLTFIMIEFALWLFFNSIVWFIRLLQA